MKRLTLFLILTGVAAFTMSSAHAARPGVPAEVYPAGAHMTYRPNLSNAAMDCMWGAVCEDGLPLFHINTQDTLHRLGGWAQFAGVHRHGRVSMAFELFVSSYDSQPNLSGMPWSELAFGDLEKAIDLHNYEFASAGSPLLPGAPRGGSVVAVKRDGRQDLLVMAWWSGSTEVEGVAMYDHGPASKSVAWRSLARQIQTAWASSAPASTRTR